MTGPPSPLTCRVLTGDLGDVAGLSPSARRHPLATRSGIALFGRILAAQAVWRDLTTPGRQALVDSYQAAVAGAAVGDRIPLPALVDVHPRTASALRRRGLIEHGRLTPAAVDVVTYAGLDPPSRPTTSPPTTPGGLP